MKDNLLFDFTVDKPTKTVFVNFLPAFPLYGMLLPNKKFWINGGHLNPGPQKQKL